MEMVVKMQVYFIYSLFWGGYNHLLAVLLLLHFNTFIMANLNILSPFSTLHYILTLAHRLLLPDVVTVADGTL